MSPLACPVFMCFSEVAPHTFPLLMPTTVLARMTCHSSSLMLRVEHLYAGRGFSKFNGGTHTKPESLTGSRKLAITCGLLKAGVFKLVYFRWHAGR